MSAEASNEPEGPDSSGCGGVLEAAAGSSCQVDPGAADQAEDRPAAPDPAGSDSEERKEDGDELKQVCDLRRNPKHVVV